MLGTLLFKSSDIPYVRQSLKSFHHSKCIIMSFIKLLQ